MGYRDDDNGDEGNEEGAVGIASPANIGTIVSAADKDAEKYDAAMAYFLDDENDVIEKPPTDQVNVTRIVDGEEKVIFTCEIRSIDDEELRTIRQRSKERGPRGARTAESETDELRFYTLLCVETILKPDLRDQRLLAKHKRPENVLRHKMLPGERVALGDHILAFSGFGESVRSVIKNEVEAAKN